MGTRYHITVMTNPDVALSEAELKQAVDEQLRLLNQQLSTYLSDSELSRLNAVPVDETQHISANLFDVLMLSLELGWLSNGAFDITVGPLVNLWGFGPGGLERDANVPDEREIARSKSRVGFQNVEFNIVDNSVIKRRDVYIDLSAIAKGFAVDKIAELLSFAGYTDYMVEIGGELRLQGNSPKGQPWKIAIESPSANTFGQLHQAVNISGASMATSGDYRNFFEVDGKRYSHTIDPTTGYPINHQLASVTVISDSAAYADGLATAINVMGPELGMRMAESHNLAVYMIINTPQGFVAKVSKDFEPYLDQ